MSFVWSSHDVARPKNGQINWPNHVSGAAACFEYFIVAYEQFAFAQHTLRAKVVCLKFRVFCLFLSLSLTLEWPFLVVLNDAILKFNYYVRCGVNRQLICFCSFAMQRKNEGGTNGPPVMHHYFWELIWGTWCPGSWLKLFSVNRLGVLCSSLWGDMSFYMTRRKRKMNNKCVDFEEDELCK